MTKSVRVAEESTTTFPSSSLSSTSHRVGARSAVTGGEQRGEKRAVGDWPADCGQEDYCYSGGLWTIACREPEEDLEETKDGPVPIETEQGVSSS